MKGYLNKREKFLAYIINIEVDIYSPVLSLNNSVKLAEGGGYVNYHPIILFITCNKIALNYVVKVAQKLK